MKMKRMLGVIAVCALIVSSMGACGQKNAQDTDVKEDVSTSGNETTGSKDIVADPLGKYEDEITITCVRTLDSTVKFEDGNPDRASLEENIWQRAYKEQLGINLEYLWTPTTEQYNAKWNAAMATNDIPDCAVVDAITYKALVEADMVEDMTDIFEEYASDAYKQAVADENSLSMNYMTFNGRLLGLPQTGTQADGVTLMFIRKDWLDKVNMEVPTTMEELRNVAKAFQEAKLGGEKTVGIAACNSVGPGIHAMKGIMEGYKAYYDIWVKDENGGLVYGSITEQMREAVLELQKMYKEGLLPTDLATLDGSLAGESVVAGQCGITFGTFWAPLNSISDSAKADENAEWIVCGLPTSDGSSFTTSASATPSGYIFVKKGCKNPEAIVKMMNLGYKIIESADKNYNADDNGFEAFKFRFAYNAEIPWKNLNCQIAIADALPSGDTSKLSSNDKNAYDQVLAGMNGDRNGIGMLLTFGPESTFSMIGTLKEENRIVVNEYQALVTETMSSIGNDIKTNLDAAIYKVIMGDDISVFDKAIETWKKTGGDQITQEVNEWYSQK